MGEPKTYSGCALGSSLGKGTVDGTNEGATDTEGADETDGKSEGIADTEGATDPDGVSDGANEGNVDGIALGSSEMSVGLNDGERLGCDEGPVLGLSEG